MILFNIIVKVWHVEYITIVRIAIKIVSEGGVSWSTR